VFRSFERIPTIVLSIPVNFVARPLVALYVYVERVDLCENDKYDTIDWMFEQLTATLLPRVDYGLVGDYFNFVYLSFVRMEIYQYGII